MCGECNWSEDKGTHHFIYQKCDCGHAKWQWTALQSKDSDLKPPFKSIYRCTKCDSLKLAYHLLHSRF